VKPSKDDLTVMSLSKISYQKERNYLACHMVISVNRPFHRRGTAKRGWAGFGPAGKAWQGTAIETDAGEKSSV